MGYNAEFAGTGITVEDRRLGAVDADADALGAAVEGLGQTDALVLWLRAGDLARLAKAADKPPGAGAVLMSGLLGGLENTPLTPA